MKTSLLFFYLWALSGFSLAGEDISKEVLKVTVRAKIVEAPKPFTFPGSQDGYKTAKPRKGSSSRLQIIMPKELKVRL